MRTAAALRAEAHHRAHQRDDADYDEEAEEAHSHGSSISDNHAIDFDDGFAPTRPTRLKLLAVEEARYNVLLHFLLEAAQRRGVRHVCGDMLQALSHETGPHAGCEAWLLRPLATGESPVNETREMLGDLVLPKLRELRLNTYLGSKQLLLLSELVQTVPAPCSAGTPTATHTTYSLLPFLELLELRGAVVGFPPAGPRPAILTPAHEAYLALFRALTGHPSLRRLDLTGSGVGPLLLPALQRLVRRTPSLCDVVLTGTALSADEQVSVHAQCRVNALRAAQRAAAGGGGGNSASGNGSGCVGDTGPPPEWVAALDTWVLDKAREMRDALRGRASESADTTMDDAMTSPYIAHECTEREADSILYALYGWRRPRDSRSSQGRAREVRTQVRPSTDTRGDTPEEDSDGSASASVEMERSGSDCSDGEGGPDGVAASPLLTLPYLRYRLPREDPHVLSRSCEEVLRAAFIPAQVATRTFLGGREVPCGVPGPLSHLSGRATGLTSAGHAALKAGLSESALLRALRRVILPPPARPRGVPTGCATQPGLLTTAENYHMTVATQDRQWDRVLEKMVAFAVPVLVPPVGAVLYDVGDAPYWLTFLPPTTEAQVEVTVRYPVAEGMQETTDEVGGGDDLVTYCPRPGECFGEVEMLGGGSYHISAADLLERRADARRHGSRPPRAALLVKQLQRAREATARVKLVNPSTSGGVVLWQFPLEVVFFLFNEPYAAMQRQMAATARLARAPDVPAPLYPVIVSLLHTHSVVRHAAMRSAARDAAGAPSVAETAASPKADGRSPDVVADAGELQRYLYILEEGEYTLCTVTPGGKMVEQGLLPGTLLTGVDVYVLDAGLRQARREASGVVGGRATVDLLAAGTAVGKEAALRQFREAKRRARLAAAAAASASASTATDGQGLAAEAAGDAAPTAGVGEQTLRLGRPGGATATGAWRFSTLTADQFASLPASVRLALTERCVVVEPFS